MGFRLVAALTVFLIALPAQADYPDDCLGPVEPSLPDCPPGVTYQGCCDSEGRVVYCQAGKFLCLDCASLSPTCGWTPGKNYNCGTDGTPDPSGVFSPVCDFCAPSCVEGQNCVDGECVDCQPACAEMECGFDGCGGSCGNCPTGEWCDGAGKCESAVQCPPTQDLKCESVVEGTTVGTKNTLEGYACTGKDSGGGELAYRFVPPSDGVVRFELSSTGDVSLRMYLTHTQCTPAACFAIGHELLEVSLQANTEYYLILDGKADGEGEFELKVTCTATCLPDCTNSECGTDGCFSSCGDCKAPEECYGGQCFANDGCTPTYLKGCSGCVCEECVCAADSWCCDVAWDEACVNRCDVDCAGCGLSEYCGDATCQSPAEDCLACPEDCPCVCGDGDCQPKLENCTLCPEDCLCAADEMCFEGNCICAPQCDEKQCGFDGCGGECGPCPNAQDVCVQGLCVCQPNCTALDCGPDGCAGSCGSCPANSTCTEGLCLALPDIVSADVKTDIPAIDLGPEATENKPADSSGCCAGGTNGPLAFFLTILLSLMVGWAFKRRRA